MIQRREILAGVALSTLLGTRAVANPITPSAGITRIDPALDQIIGPTASVEILARGFRWAEGPIWVPQGGYLLFTDPPANIIYRWTRAQGAEPFLHPSGLQTPVPAGIREPGANGMAIDDKGRLIIADSGSRAIVRIDIASGNRTILADRFEGKRFNSPNDLAIARSGAIYFTDPPYGLADSDRSPLRELDFCGLYRLAPDGSLTLLDRTHHRPNGVALSPNGERLYLALSDESCPEVVTYSLDGKGMPISQSLFQDMQPQLRAGLPGLPDGIKVGPSGHIFATGPGGIHVCTPSGELLGIVSTGKAIANCCVGAGGTELFMTSSDMLAVIPLAPSA
jgi:gluconolactonase